MARILRALAFLSLLIAASTARAVGPAEAPSLPELDVASSAAHVAPLGPSATAAVLRARFGAETRSRLDPATGRAGFLIRTDAAALTAARPGTTPEKAALAFLRENRDLLAVAPGAIEALEVRRRDDDGSGLVVLRFAPKLDGTRVFGAEARVAVDPVGAVRMVSVAGLSGATASAIRHRWDARRALASLGAAIDSPCPEGRALRTLRDLQEIACGSLRRPGLVERVWFQEGGSLRPAWKGLLAPSSTQEYWQVVVEDGTGRLLHRRELTLYAATRGSIFEIDPVSGPRAVLTFPDDRYQGAVESPDGWAFDAETLGPNVDAKDDRAADDEATPGVRATAGGAGTPADPYLFDPPFTDDPAADLEAGVLHLFRNVNEAHDRFYRLGFDEAAGNFQTDNFGRGGLGGDPVLADAQDGGGLCNASFQPAPDGVPGRMTMFVWHDPAGGCDPATPGRDSSLDADVVYHEMAHGVSNRLVGGTDDALCLFSAQSGALGEAWSDFYGGSFTDDPVIGGWSSFDPVRGVRTQAMNAPDGRYTYGDLCTIAGGPIPCEVHADGEIWAQAMWEIRRALRAELGDAQGTERAERIVLAGMKLTPCQPSFLDARDAILAAEQLLYGGVHHCLLWRAFALHGMGVGASTTGANDQAPIEDFAVPAACTTDSWVAFDRDSYLCSDQVVVTVRDAALPSAPQVAIDAQGDTETIVLPDAAETTVSAPIPLSVEASFVAEDGTLQPQSEGTILRVAYLDSGGATVEDTAVVDCTAVVRVLEASLVEESCDDDTVAGYPDLPRFLDADESGVLRVRLAGETPGKTLEGAAVSLTTSHPAISIEPSGAIVLGDLPPMAGGIPGREVTLVFAVTAAGPLPSPDTADFSLNLTADGALRGAGDGFQLVLNQDYLLEPLVLEDDMETGAPGWIHDPGSPPDDEWGLETCQASSGTTSWHNGASGCGDYSDDQADPWLATPALPVPAGTVALRVDRVEYQHRIDLGSFPVSPEAAIDVDAVAVLLQNEPISVDPSDPFALLTEALAGYANFPGLIDSNTGGAWEAEGIDVPAATSEGLDLGLPIRLVWAFLPDVSDVFFPCENFFCDVQGEGYYLDDLRIEYEVVRTAPQAAACSPGACRVALNVSPTVQGPLCPGDPVSWDATASSALGCPSGLEISWTDDQGAPLATGTVFDQDPGPMLSEALNVTATCLDDAGCTSTRQLRNVVQDDLPPSIRVALRVARDGTDATAVAFRLVGMPPSATSGDYELFGSEDPAGLALPTPDEQLGRDPLDPGAPLVLPGLIGGPALTFHRAFGISGCTGELVDP